MKANKTFTSESGRIFNEGDETSQESLEYSKLTEEEIKNNFGDLPIVEEKKKDFKLVNKGLI